MNIGHNGGAQNSAAYADGDEIVFHYAQWHIGDYIAGTMGMSLEIEGAYQRFLMRLYQRGKPLPDDDRFMATAMALSLRVWKRMKTMLIDLGKIVVRAGCLTNGRFEQERRKRAEEIQKRASAARKRWENSRETSAKFASSLAETSPKVEANTSKKPNKINAPSIQMDMLTNNQNPITNNQEKEEASSLRSEGAEAPAIETAAEIVWGKGMDWLRDNSFVGNEAKLRARVGGWVKDYGAETVLTVMRAAQKSKPGSVMTWMEKVLRENDRADQHVKRQGGRLEVFNGFQAELSQILGNRDLRRSLDRIGGKIPVHVTGVELESRVRALAIEMVDQAEDQDRRYQRAAAGNKKAEEKWL
jgi:uncharacterized protein YdaU (DUF1376 family)